MIQTKADMIAEYRQRAKVLDLEPKVYMDGSINAPIAVIGEAPGEGEIKTGVPFSGGAGAKLWNSLRKRNVKRIDCYISNVIKRQVSMGKNKEHNKVPPKEEAYWIQMINWEMRQLPNLKYILVLGNVALKAITGHYGIIAWRGSVLDIEIGGRPIKVICTVNPAMTSYQPKWEVLFDFDLNKLRLVLDGNYKPYPIEHIINPSLNDAVGYIQKMRSDKLPVSLDIETVANETACIGLTNDPHEGMCINFRDAEGNTYSLQDEIILRKAFQELFDDPDTKIVAQNGTFDHYWLWYKDNLNLHRVTFDTLLAHHTLYPTLPHNLGALTAQYTTHPYYKDDGQTWKEKGNINQFWEYNVKDVCITLAVRNAIEKELVQQGLKDFFYNHVMRLQPHTVRSTVYGINVDKELRASLNDQLTDDVQVLQQECIDLARVALKDPEYNYNPGSWQQLRKLFFHDLKLVGRGTKTDKVNRARMRSHSGTSEVARQMLVKIDKYKEEKKFLGTYVESKLDPDGRYRCEYKQYGTQSAPGRLSSAAVMWGNGGNLQNQPQRAYAMYQADNTDCGFAYFDLAQAEARVVGYLAGIEKWIEDFEHARLTGNFDCHRSLASDMWDIPYEDIPKTDYNSDGTHSLRFVAKRCRHGLNYRMMPPRLAETTGLNMYDASNAYNLYHKTNPELKKWWDHTIKEVKSKRELWSPFGRRQIWLERIDDDALDSVVAFKPQSTIGDWVCRVWYLSEEDTDWPTDCRIALNVHDALIAHGPIANLPSALKVMKKYAEEPMDITDINGITRSLIIPMDAKITEPDEQGIHRWSTLKDYVL